MGSELNAFKKMYANLVFEEPDRKKALRPAEKREAVGYLTKEEGLSIRQVCIVINLSSPVYYYRFKQKDKDKWLIEQLESLAEKYPTYGFRKMEQKGLNGIISVSIASM